MATENAEEVHRAFHDLCVAVMPKQDLPEHRYWVGILNHTITPGKIKDESDFLWIKANRKTIVRTIWHQYYNKHPMEFVLEIDGTIPSMETGLADLNDYGDNAIIFRAVEKASLADHPDLVHRSIESESYGIQASSRRDSPSPIESSENSRFTACPEHPDEQWNCGTFEAHGAHGDLGSADQPVLIDGLNEATTEKVCDDGYCLSHHEAESGDNNGIEITKQAYLRQQVGETMLGQFELASVRTSKALKHLRGLFEHHGQTTAELQQWVESISRLEKQCMPANTIIGIVGAPGAGKKSIVNAVLNEERLLPANNDQTPYPFVTQFAWNSSADDVHSYRAEMEFIKPEEWEVELRILFDNLLDENGEFSTEHADKDSKADVAYATLRAVYPQLTVEDISRSSPASLARDPTVLKLLGTTRNIIEASSTKLYQKIAFTLNGQEDPPGNINSTNEEAHTVKYWPLIQSVKIYVKAAALSTGAIIVNFPPVQCLSATRRVQVLSHMKECRYFWIITPIIRATDDHFLESLPRDILECLSILNEDISPITIIYSKADNVLVTEVIDALDIAHEIRKAHDNSKALKTQIMRLQHSINTLNEELRLNWKATEEQSADLTRWQSHLKRLSESEIAHIPEIEKKRKIILENSTKRRKTELDAGKSGSSVIVSLESDKSDSQGESAEQPHALQLTKETILSKIEELQEAKERKINNRGRILGKIEDMKREVSEAIQLYKACWAKIRAPCIAHRNEHIKGAFYEGLLRQRSQTRQEETQGDRIRNGHLEDSAASIKAPPVFCVSSQVYQQLKGLFPKDRHALGFNTPDDTEIPQLQRHCQGLCGAARAAARREFLRDLSEGLESLTSWVASPSSERSIPDLNAVSQQLDELYEIRDELFQLVGERKLE